MKQKHKAALSGFEKVIALAFPMITVAFVLWNFQAKITSVKLFSILMTLGGLETYNDTVLGILLIMLIVGVYVIVNSED